MIFGAHCLFHFIRTSFIIGWLIAYFAGDREVAKFHMNQSLVLFIGAVISTMSSYLPLIGGITSWVLNIAIFVFWIMGLISACEDREKELPVIGSIKILQ